MKKLVSLLSMVPVAALAASPTISAPEFAYDAMTGVATIEYTLSGATAIVTLDVLTNDVSIGAENYVGAWGDVWQRVKPGETKRKIKWRPRRSWGDVLVNAANAGTLTFDLKANTLDDPPKYMVVSLSTTSNVFFYADLNQLPGGKGLGDNRYKTDWLVMRRIPAAGVTWRMGKAPYQSPGNRDFPCAVTLSEDFYAAVYETTAEQMWQVTKAYRNSFAYQADFQPLENITYNGLRGAAYDFPKNGHSVAPDSALGLMRAKTGLEIDLPTDAQWEYACRAGTGTLFNNGSDNSDAESLSKIAWLSSTVNKATTDLRPLPVGLLQPNAWGLYDMHGNVWELCLDWCIKELSGEYTDLVGPDDNPDTGKVFRGSSWGQGGSWQAFVPSSHRNYVSRTYNCGCRLFCPATIPDL